MMKMKNQESYVKFLRFAAFCVVAFLWVLSIMWSADGFSVRRPELAWVGIGLALSVTVAQLVFNRGSINPTLFIVGLAAYVYGISTNVAGINEALRIDLSLSAWQSEPFGTVIDALILLGLSLVVEIFPESLLLWAIYPELRSPGDFISTLAGGMNIKNKPQNRPNLSINRKITNKREPDVSFNLTNVRNNLTNEQTPFSRLIWSKIPDKSRTILNYAQHIYKQTNRIPGPTEVSNAIYGTDKQKGFVSETYKKYKIRGS